jgi:hypothetical protein
MKSENVSKSSGLFPIASYFEIIYFIFDLSHVVMACCGYNKITFKEK